MLPHWLYVLTIRIMFYGKNSPKNVKNGRTPWTQNIKNQLETASYASYTPVLAVSLHFRGEFL